MNQFEDRQIWDSIQTASYLYAVGKLSSEPQISVYSKDKAIYPLGLLLWELDIIVRERR